MCALVSSNQLWWSTINIQFHQPLFFGCGFKKKWGDLRGIDSWTINILCGDLVCFGSERKNSRAQIWIVLCGWITFSRGGVNLRTYGRKYPAVVLWGYDLSEVGDVANSHLKLPVCLVITHRRTPGQFIPPASLQSIAEAAGEGGVCVCVYFSFSHFHL